MRHPRLMQFDTGELGRLSALMYEIATRGRPMLITRGLCINAMLEINYEMVTAMEIVAECWPLFSGEHQYPVPATNADTPRMEFYNARKRDQLYSKDHKYGRLRLALAQYIADEVTRHLIDRNAIHIYPRIFTPKMTFIKEEQAKEQRSKADDANIQNNCN